MSKFEIKNIIGYLIVVSSIIFSTVLIIISIAEDPNKDIQFKSQFIKEKVEIILDEYGFPKIYSSNKNDYFFGLAYYQASERFWQINFIRDLMKGNLQKENDSNIGRQDQLFKSLNFNKLASDIYKSLDTNKKEELIHFSNGLNEYLIQNSNALSIDFQSYNYTPESWTPIDIVLIDLYYSIFFDYDLYNSLNKSSISSKNLLLNLFRIDQEFSNKLYYTKSDNETYISASKINHIDFPSNFIFISSILDSTVSSGFYYSGTPHFTSMIEENNFMDYSFSKGLWTIDIKSEKELKDSIEYIIDTVTIDDISKKFYKIKYKQDYYYQIDQSDSLFRIQYLKDQKHFYSKSENLSFIDSSSISIDKSSKKDSSMRRKRLKKLTDGQRFDILDLHIINNDIYSSRYKSFLEKAIPIIDNYSDKLNPKEKKILEDIKIWDGLIIKNDTLSFIISNLYSNYKSKASSDELNFMNDIPRKNFSYVMNSFRESINLEFKQQEYEISSSYYSNNMFEYIYKEKFTRSGDKSTIMYINTEKNKIYSNSYRMDFKQGDSIIHLNIPLGQSGNLNSPNSKDQFRLWLNGGYIKFVHSQSRIKNISKRIVIER